MKGIYTVERKSGTAVYISYTSLGQARVRDLVEFVSEGREFTRRLREAKKRAEKVLVKRKAAIVDGKHDLPGPKRSMTFARFVERHYGPELRERGLRTAEVEIHRLTKGPLGAFFGSMVLANIDEWKVRKFIKARKDGTTGREVGPGAINRDLARLCNLWNRAARLKLVRGFNPVREIGRLHEPKHRVRYLTVEEEERLLAELSPPLRALVEVALHTGIRRGALLGLCWRDLDFRTDTILVPEDLSKSREPYPVHMNTRVREILADLRTRAAFTGPDDFVFPKRDGSRRTSLRNSFEAACLRAGIEGFRFHDLRHTAASRIVENGGSLFDAAQHLGHRTLEMTKRYAHLSPNHMKGIADLTMRKSKAEVVPIGQRDSR